MKYLLFFLYQLYSGVARKKLVYGKKYRKSLSIE